MTCEKCISMYSVSDGGKCPNCGHQNTRTDVVVSMTVTVYETLTKLMADAKIKGKLKTRNDMICRALNIYTILLEESKKPNREVVVTENGKVIKKVTFP